MKRYIFIGLVMSVLSACSNNVLNPEASKQVQAQPPEKKVKPPVLGTSNEWDSSFDCDPIKVRNLIGKTGLTEKQVLSMTNARIYRSAYPGEALTEDLRPDRVTVVIDPKTKRIVVSACG
ncbi:MULTISPECIES: hypothetical protein [unclassified Acinetobacter]|uniref:hypothetical protein n=1 Tax=unclassified Acinetobacter TaxID=196816 RepID=UPI002FDC284C